MASSNSNLPEDILQEILLRLPVKSLVRFMCVSRSLFALLKSPDFIDMHLKFSLTKDHGNLLITRFDPEEKRNKLSIHSNDESLTNLVPNLQLHGYTDHRFLRFAGSCHGIICFSTGRDIILFNPAIREFRTLPCLPSPSDCFITRVAGVGFGFDPVSHDYKVVQIRAIFDGRISHSKVIIYNLSTDNWRELDVVLPSIAQNVDGSSGLSFNGKFHWRAYYLSGKVFDCEEFIFSMDISTEVFHKFRYPKVDEIIIEGQNLLVIKDSLSLVLLLKTRVPPCEQMINIWVMKEYGVEESWSKQYSIGPFFGFLCPLFVWKNEQLLLKVAVYNTSKYDCELVTWDAHKKVVVQKYDVHGDQYTMGVVFYNETLASITHT